MMHAWMCVRSLLFGKTLSADEIRAKLRNFIANETAKLASRTDFIRRMTLQRRWLVHQR